MWRVVGCLVITAHVAAASPAVAVVLAPGMRVHTLSGELDEDTTEASPSVLAAVEATIAVRTSPRLAIGLHLGTSQALAYNNVYPFGNSPYANFQIRPYDVGVAALYSADRLWAEPWLGATLTDAHADGNTLSNAIPAMSTTWSYHGLDTGLAFGLTAGLDIVASNADRVGVFLALQRQPIGFGGNPAVGTTPTYFAVTFGVVYRRW